MPAPKGHKAYNTKGEGGLTQVQTDAFIEKEADALLKWLQNPDNMYFKKFALERGYSPQRLSEFAQRSERFKEALEKAKSWQEIRLVEGGLLGNYNATMTKFVMANCHGWQDRQQQTISGDATSPLSFLLSKVDGTTKDLIDNAE